MNSTEYDDIIVGQGLAGTTLAWALRWRGRRVLVIDRGRPGTSSLIAAGLMTPITGRRLMKCWRWDEFWGFARQFYQKVESETSCRFFEDRAMVRLLATTSEREFLQRRQSSEFRGMLTEPVPPLDEDSFQFDEGGFEMQGGRLDVSAFLQSSRRRFELDSSFAIADLDPVRDIELHAGGIHIGRLALQSRRLIFCQGYEPTVNPWFANVRFKPAKGEILTLRIEGLEEQRIVHRGVWLMPLGDNLFRAGATYEWNDLDSQPTEKGREEICGRLREFLRVPFEVIGHDAAVRPILLHQYAAVGPHPVHPQLAFFNGLGSKGSLQAPWLADQLAGHLLGEHPLDPAVDLHLYERSVIAAPKERAAE